MTRSAPPGWLYLEDGSAFPGRWIAGRAGGGEVVFNTSMTGYQEVLTDPSYRGQIVTMTQPHIGNYGLAEVAQESERPWVDGFIVREMTTARGLCRGARGEVGAWLDAHDVPVLEGVDTRALVRRLRHVGAMRGFLSDRELDPGERDAALAGVPPMKGRDLVREVSRGERVRRAADGPERCRLAVWDFGCKESIFRELQARGASLDVLPPATSASVLDGLEVDGVVLSNGPGDPAALDPIVTEVRELLARQVPLLGICLGHQLLARAVGGETEKMAFGHHGGNQPVQELASGRVSITSQNHGFTVVAESLGEGAKVSERNLNDRTVEGLALDDRPVLSVQYHPEAAPGPRESASIFDRFLALLG